jgi:hypothetical protein
LKEKTLCPEADVIALQNFTFPSIEFIGSRKGARGAKLNSLRNFNFHAVLNNPRREIEPSDLHFHAILPPGIWLA